MTAASRHVFYAMGASASSPSRRRIPPLALTMASLSGSTMRVDFPDGRQAEHQLHPIIRPQKPVVDVHRVSAFVQVIPGGGAQDEKPRKNFLLQGVALRGSIPAVLPYSALYHVQPCHPSLAMAMPFVMPAASACGESKAESGQSSQRRDTPSDGCCPRWAPCPARSASPRQ